MAFATSSGSPMRPIIARREQRTEIAFEVEVWRELTSRALPSPRLRTAPIIARREYDYSRDLRLAKWGCAKQQSRAADVSVGSRGCRISGDANCGNQRYSC